jgi:hypothetical protein
MRALLLFLASCGGSVDTIDVHDANPDISIRDDAGAPNEAAFVDSKIEEMDAGIACPHTGDICDSGISICNGMQAWTCDGHAFQDSDAAACVRCH